MARKRLFVSLVTALVGTALGCASPTDRPYESLQDIDAARSRAGLIVQGEVTGTEGRDRYPVAGRDDGPLRWTTDDYAIKTQVTVRVTKVLKGQADPAEPLSFWFLSPASHLDPDVLLGRSLPPVMRGDKLRVFLERQGGAWWLVAHERWYRPPQPVLRDREGPMLAPGARFIMVPVPPTPAGATPSGPAPASPGTSTTTPAPSTPAPPTRRPRFTPRPPRSRPWPPPRS